MSAAMKLSSDWNASIVTNWRARTEILSQHLALRISCSSSLRDAHCFDRAVGEQEVCHGALVVTPANVAVRSSRSVVDVWTRIDWEAIADLRRDAGRGNQPAEAELGKRARVGKVSAIRAVCRIVQVKAADVLPGEGRIDVAEFARVPDQNVV